VIPSGPKASPASSSSSSGLGLLTVYDPVIGGGVMVVLAGLALIAKGVADSTMRAFGLK